MCTQFQMTVVRYSVKQEEWWATSELPSPKSSLESFNQFSLIFLKESLKLILSSWHGCCFSKFVWKIPSDKHAPRYEYGIGWCSCGNFVIDFCLLLAHAFQRISLDCASSSHRGECLSTWSPLFCICSNHVHHISTCLVVAVLHNATHMQISSHFSMRAGVDTKHNGNKEQKIELK